MPEPEERRRWLPAVVALAAAGAIVAGLVLFARLSPWIEPPKYSERDIERRWAAVQEWARRAESGPIGPLGDLEVDARPAGRSLRRLLDRLGDDDADMPRILDAEVTGPARRTVARLEAWHRSEGGLDPIACMNAQPDVLAARDAVRIALLSAERPGAERTEAALALIRALQRQGSLVHAMLGDVLAVEATRVFADRGWPVTDALRATRPVPEVLFSALARDALCKEEMIRSLAGETVAGDWAVHEDPTGAAQEWPPLGLIDLERERLVLRGHFGALLDAAHAHRDDYAGMAEAIAAIEADPPRSVLLTIVAIDLAERIRERAETRDRFDALVATLPRRVEPPGGTESAPAN